MRRGVDDGGHRQDAGNGIRVLRPGALNEAGGSTFPTGQGLLVTLELSDPHLGIDQLLNAICDVQGYTDVRDESRHDTAQGCGSVNPLRMALRESLRDKSTHRITPHVHALGRADLLGKECVELLAGEDTILDRPSVLGVRGSGQCVPTLQQ